MGTHERSVVRQPAGIPWDSASTEYTFSPYIGTSYYLLVFKARCFVVPLINLFDGCKPGTRLLSYSWYFSSGYYCYNDDIKRYLFLNLLKLLL